MLEGERTQVTVLLPICKDSMELLDDYDSKEARAILDSILEWMIAPWTATWVPSTK